MILFPGVTLSGSVGKRGYRAQRNCSVTGNVPSVLMLRLFCLDVSRLEEVRVQPKPKVAMISE
ncbi:hypothetical protein [Paenibacillus sp. J45TS6]|uniref:hypothetical protein n=1 Tax=Paenibacillus sp. J45TS6 TaxID=2807196 RepID=UPI001BCDD6A6|nr:hypothetical protein [Paenibacillus sp. J45TS6]